MKSKKYPNKDIAWEVSYGKREAEVYLGGPLPGWIHEYGSKCRWKIIKGAHLL